LGGRLSKKLIEAAGFRKIKLIDYLEREELSVLNAIPTCEGALEIALRETEHTIFGSRCLVAGYGRLGKVLANMLRDLGANVSVMARKHSDFAWIKVNRLTPVLQETLTDCVEAFELIFNTIPARIFDAKILARAQPKTLVIDLASSPGGVDLDAANNHEIKAVSALSLPGKVAPLTAAEIIFETITNIINEEQKPE